MRKFLLITSVLMLTLLSGTASLRADDELEKLKKEREKLLRENRELQMRLRTLKFLLRSYQKRLREGTTPQGALGRLQKMVDSFLRELGREGFKILKKNLPRQFHPLLKRFRKILERRPNFSQRPSPTPRPRVQSVSPARMANMYYRRAMAMMRQKRYSEAVKFFSRALTYLPNNAQLYFSRGNAYLFQKKFAEAEKDYLKAISLNSRFAVAQYNLACTYALQGKKEKALEWLKKSIENGFQDFEHIRKDPDLKSLHGDPRFQKLLKKRWK